MKKETDTCGRQEKQQIDSLSLPVSHAQKESHTHQQERVFLLYSGGSMLLSAWKNQEKK